MERNGIVPPIAIVAVVIVIILVGAAAVLLSQAPSEEPSDNEERFLLGIAMHTQVGIWHKALATYAEWYAEDLGMDVIVTSAEYDPALQQRQVSYMIDAGIDGLVWIPAEALAAAPIATLCKEAGIPNITFNEDVDSPDVDLNITVGYRKIAMLATKEAVARYEEQHGTMSGPIFEVYGGLETPFSILMHDGFMDTMVNYPDVDIYSIDANWDPATVKMRISDLISAHGKPTMIFAGGWGPLGDSAYLALEDAGMAYPVEDPNHVFVVCGDCSPGFLGAIGEGKEDIAYTEVEQFLAGMPVYFAWKMMNEGVDSVLAGLPEVGSSITAADLDDDLVALGGEHFGINPWDGPVWEPAVFIEEYGHPRINLAGALITKTGTTIGVSSDEIGCVSYDDVALYVNQIPLMEEQGFEGF